jgi:hypothetical protein
MRCTRYMRLISWIHPRGSETVLNSSKSVLLPLQHFKEMCRESLTTYYYASNESTYCPDLYPTADLNMASTSLKFKFKGYF